MDDLKNIERYYNSLESAHHEWTRFDRHRFEFPITTRHIKKYITPGSKVIDIGGGPGRYSFELAQMGCEVTLFDLSRSSVEYAKRKSKELRIPLQRYCVGDARDLSDFPDHCFDALLNFGPLYHLPDPADRRRVVAESMRVLKPGGILAVAFISVFAPIYDTVRRYSSEISARRDDLVRFIQTGTNIDSKEVKGFADAYFVDPDSITPFMESFGVESRLLFGAESFIAQSEFRIMDLSESTLEEWIDFAYETSTSRAGIYGSDHIVYIGETSNS